MAESQLGRTIAREMQRRGWTNLELSKRSGVSDATISRIVRGRTQSPGYTVLSQIAAALGMSYSDLAKAGGLTTPEAPSIQIIGPAVLIPLVNISLAAGSAVYGETNEVWPVSPDLLPGRRLVAARVTGKCMEPEVQQGAVAVIDVADQQPRPGDLVAVLLEDGSMAIKRFERREGEPLLTDNQGVSYKPNGAKIQGVVVSVSNNYR